jgi:uncharacterized BrkB/YihY/UPF0761 family membrane protein
VTLVAVRLKINFAYSVNLNRALDASNTVVALIIGFLGAILPVILGMKNESKIVKYIFDRDKNKLFLKYIKATLICGLTTLAVAMSMYMINDYSCKMVGFVEFYIWMFLVLLFLMLTYRSLKSMLDLIFMSDKDLQSINRVKSTANEKEIEEIEEMFDEKSDDT